jgi:hypothetical protein
MPIRVLPLLFSIFIFWATGASQSVPPPSLSMTISTTPIVVNAGTDVKIEIIIKNISDHDVGVDKSPGENSGEKHTKVEVRDDKGKLVRETGYKRALEGNGGYDEVSGRIIIPMGSNMGVLLKPGETVKDGLSVNKLYYLDKPGKYTIQCQRFEDESSTWVKSNTITITVTP